MNEAKPSTLARRIESELDDAGRLKARRPTLFWASVALGAICALGWIYEHFWGKAELEKALRDEKQTVRDIRAQLTLAETRLGPFKSIAIDRYGDDSARALVRLGEDMQKFQTEFQALQAKLALAERYAAEARNLAETASAGQQPRKITPEAEQAIRYVASKTPARSKILIACRASDAEAEDFAKAIAAVFGRLGFPNQVDTLHGWEVPPGVSLDKDHENPALAELLDFALTRAELRFKKIAFGTINPPLPKPHPILLIGSKPDRLK